jgi:uncharacterized protein (TIGR02246 family)
MRSLLVSRLMLLLLFAVVALSSSTWGFQAKPKKAPAAAAAQPDQAADIKAINDLNQRDIAASKENDVDTLATLWTDDGVLIVPMTPPFVGKPAIRKLLDQQKEQAKDAETTAYDEQWEEVRIIGDYAYQWGSISVTVELPGGKQVSQTVGAMRILQRQKDGEWLVARAIVTPAPKAAAK